MEKVSALAKDTKIKTLEDLVIKVGYDPANINAAEEFIHSFIKEAIEITSYKRSFDQGY